MNRSPTPRRTVIHDGKILFFGLDDFLDRIAPGRNCFVCGAPKDSIAFNDEHVIPDWILRRYGLHSKQITLPNRTTVFYRQYKVSCCSECNSALGRLYEGPISDLLGHSYEQITRLLKADPSVMSLLFRWLSLIYLKIHLKSNSLRYERDTRIQSGTIGDLVDWKEMHHIHCIARSLFTEAEVDPRAHGSVLVLPAIVSKGLGQFDYADSMYGKSILLQLGEFAIVSTLNDADAGANIAENILRAIEGSLTPFQLREILAHLSFINVNLAERPEFFSEFSSPLHYRISVRLPSEWNLLDERERLASVGKFLRFYVEDMIPDHDNKKQFLEEIEEGRRAYLFDENGKFIDNRHYFE